ncbi:adenine deaminase [Methanofollis aquaemaris]|uniref:Adenine deaminase n=1 Tax=Methanofollis aquaemaris TaxID=126734 RepID=A0A8A3RZV7_9EURY|nr:adenine deaminase [Methanofollis aquaemaris]QSZ66067.1 adenine deaminase [Methanofollis aquaemaris]
MDECMNAARGSVPADRLFTGLSLYNPFTCTWEETSFAVKDGRVVGMGEGYEARETVDLGGARVVPGLIDAHVHIESSLLTPREYARAVLPRGTTTVVADPHEIANVSGKEGIEFVLSEGSRSALSVLVTLPSCVPATPLDEGGAVLTADDLAEFVGREGVAGLGEMMNVPGVLNGDPEVWKKLGLFRVREGHAPMLSGKDLNAYIFAGIQSDHESTTLEEAEEKLRLGMYIMMREGSTERNIRALAPLLTPCTSSRCCLATDDRHADMLVSEGHIDDCIRKLVKEGVPLEVALRAATLSSAQRFGLEDRGAVAPGRRADFCVLKSSPEFEVAATYVQGVRYEDPGYQAPACPPPVFRCRPPDPADLAVGGRGMARVIGLNRGQIVTDDLRCRVETVPDLEHDILKVVVCDRYRHGGCGVGLVRGFGMKEGAIAASVSHDTHNIVAVGVSDEEICRAVREVTDRKGAMVAVRGERVTVLPLPCGGLMATEPYPEVCRRLEALKGETAAMGAVDDPFMYLSFLALTVIPHLRVTDRGVFDAAAFADVPLFCEEEK